MELVSFTPKECKENILLGCDKLVAHARFQTSLESQE
jgi:hypothetical protein